MLRYAHGASKMRERSIGVLFRSNSHPCGLVFEPLHRSGTLRFGRRLKSSNSNREQSEISRFERTRGPSRPAGNDFARSGTRSPSDRKGQNSGLASSFQKDTFFQRLKVGPKSENNVSGLPQRSETLNKSQTRNPHGPQSDRKQPFPRPFSAAQSNLQGSSNSNTDHSNLIEFFQKRLEDANKNVVKNKDSKDAPSLRSSIRSRLKDVPPQTQSQKPIAPLRRPGPGNPQLGGLRSARAEARMAEETARDSSGNWRKSSLFSVSDVVVEDKTVGNSEPSGISGESTEPDTISPIRQFIKDLKERNNGGTLSSNSTAKSAVPSWRKSARSNFAQTRQDSIEPLFSTRKRYQNQYQWEQQQYQHQRQNQQQQQQPHISDAPGAERTSPPKVSKPREITLPMEDATVVELSKLFGIKVDIILETLRGLGEDPNRKDSYAIDTDTMEMVALELNIQYQRPSRRQKVDNDHKQLMDRRKVSTENAEASTEAQVSELLVPRPPVVCIMGHVDHGKTTLMDALRRRANKDGGGSKKKSKGKKKEKGSNGDMAGTEAGGITQIVSAFQVRLSHHQEAITFLDTPGHAAFSAMRHSGSHAADILVLVIAADDGVSPQTVEIINFYKSIVKDSNGGISLVVAMNKIDKPGIDVEESKRRIENQLLELGIIPEGVASHEESEFGSPVQLVPISAKTGEGIDDLIEGLSLQSEIMDLRADDNARAEGIVMDARIEQGLGVVVDCIIRWGSIKTSDVLVSGTHSGKVRILKDVDDKTIKKGRPSQPVRIVGFKTPPKAGDPILCVASEELAEDLVARRIAIQEKKRAGESPDNPQANFSQFIISGRESMTAFGTEKTLERYDIDLENTGPIRIPVIVKAKADGSVAAVRDSLHQLGAESHFDIYVDTIAQGVGPLTRSDVEMAKESNACVFCFDVKNQDKAVLALAESEGVTVHEYNVIYSLLDDAKEVFKEYLPPVPTEVVHGKAEVQSVFSINGGKDAIAGLKVTDGMVYKKEIKVDNAKSAVHFRVVRKGETVSPDGETLYASSLRKFKEDVENVRHGEECGLGLTGFADFQEGDIIECYSIEMKKSFA